MKWNKQTRIVLLIAAGLFAAGLLLCGGALAAVDGDFARLSTSYGEARRQAGHEFDPAEMEIGRVELFLQTDDLRVTPSADGRIHLEFMEREETRFTLSCADGVLTLRQSPARGFRWFRFDLGFREDTVFLALPAGFDGDVLLHSDVGDTAVEALDITGALDCDLGVGSCDIRGLTARSVTVQSDTGDVGGSDWQVRAYVFVDSDTGAVTLTDCAAGGSLHCETDVGRQRLERVTADEAELYSNTGDVELEALAADRITIDSDVGAVTGTLAGRAGDYTIRCETDVGDSNLPDRDADTGKTLSVQTDVGDIALTFLE